MAATVDGGCARGRKRDDVSLNAVFRKRNLRETSECLLFAKGLGVADARFNDICSDGFLRGWREWAPSFHEAAPEIVKAIVLNERHVGLRLTFGGMPCCALRWAGVLPRLGEALADRHLDEAAFDPDIDVNIPSAAGGCGDRFVCQERKRDVLKRRGRTAADCEGVWRTYAEIYELDELTPLYVPKARLQLCLRFSLREDDCPA